MANALPIQCYSIMPAGGNWVNNMHGNLNCYYSKKRASNCIIVLYKQHDDIHGQSGIIQTVADVLSLNKSKPGYVWGKRYLCLNRMIRTLQLGKK